MSPLPLDLQGDAFDGRRLVILGAGGLGVVGSLFFIISYFVFRTDQTQARRLICQLSICDLIQAVFCTMNILYADTTTPEGCLYVGAPLHFSTLASALWTASIGIFVCRTVSTPGVPVDEGLLRRFEWVSWGVPIAVVLATLAVTTHQEGAPSYMSRGVCLSPVHPAGSEIPYHWLSYRIPLIGCFTVTLIMYFRARSSTLRIHWVLKTLVYSSPRHPVQSLRGVAWKFMFVPIVFLFTRGWGTLLSAAVFFLGRDWGPAAYYLPFLETAIFSMDAAQGFINFAFFALGTKQVRDQWVHWLSPFAGSRRVSDPRLLLSPTRPPYEGPRHSPSGARPTQPLIDAAALSQFRV